MVRVRNRYLLCVVEFERESERALCKVTSRHLHNAFRSSIEDNFGDVGAGQAVPSLSVKLWSPALGLAVVRAHRECYQVVWAAATLLTALPPLPVANPARVSVIHVGATIRACQKAAVEHAETLIAELRRTNTPVERLQAAMETARNELAEMEPV